MKPLLLAIVLLSCGDLVLNRGAGTVKCAEGIGHAVGALHRSWRGSVFGS